jgi:hypothetical protein
MQFALTIVYYRQNFPEINTIHAKYFEIVEKLRQTVDIFEIQYVRSVIKIGYEKLKCLG